jgi:hypothetical protein
MVRDFRKSNSFCRRICLIQLLPPGPVKPNLADSGRAAPGSRRVASMGRVSCGGVDGASEEGGGWRRVNSGVRHRCFLPWFTGPSSAVPLSCRSPDRLSFRRPCVFELSPASCDCHPAALQPPATLSSKLPERHCLVHRLLPFEPLRTCRQPAPGGRPRVARRFTPGQFSR